MSFVKDRISRRQFLKGAVATAAVAVAGPKLIEAGYRPFSADSLEVWSCGGYCRRAGKIYPYGQRTDGSLWHPRP